MPGSWVFLPEGDGQVFCQHSMRLNVVISTPEAKLPFNQPVRYPVARGAHTTAVYWSVIENNSMHGKRTRRAGCRDGARLHGQNFLLARVRRLVEDCN